MLRNSQVAGELLLRWLAAAALFAAASLACGCGSEEGSSSLRIAVMPSSFFSPNHRVPFEWAQESVAEAGGVAGSDLELVFFEEGAQDFEQLVDEILSEESFVAAIAPTLSSRLFDIAPRFIGARKPLVSPTSTSSEIFRAYGGQDYVWRLTESDIAQCKALLTIVARDHAESDDPDAPAKVALLTSFDSYGMTFFEWFGFFALELGLEPVSLVRYDQESDDPKACEAPLEQVLDEEPDTLVAIPSYVKDGECILSALYERRKSGKPVPRLLFSDGGEPMELLGALGETVMEGAEGVGTSWDGQSGFADRYRDIHETEPPSYAANIFDSVTLLAYGLEYSGGKGGEALAEGLKKAVDGRGRRTGWDSLGIKNALAKIKAGEEPDITGATGDLTYDQVLYTDLTSSTYNHWVVKGGQVEFTEYVATKETNEVNLRAAFRTLGSEAHIQKFAPPSETGGPSTDPELKVEERQGLWALIAATSHGFDNYRHQADALAYYQLLRGAGVPDDRIVLVLAGGLADNEQNLETGVVRNEPGGDNLMTDAEVDYALADVEAEDLLDILAGKKSESLPAVIEAGKDSDVFVFLVGHGGSPGLAVGGETAADGAGVGKQVDFLTPDGLAGTITEMATAEAYRRMLIVLESCHAGVFGGPLEEAKPPRVAMMTGATVFETSIAGNYDPALKIWLADVFAYELLGVAQKPGAKKLTLSEAYAEVYELVPASHARLFNTTRFGDVGEIVLWDFLGP